MQRRHGLLHLGFDRHRVNLFVPRRLEHRAGIGLIGLVAAHIPPGLVRRKQPDGMPELGERPRGCF